MAVLRSGRGAQRRVAFKGERLNIVTDADLDSEAAILAIIGEARPDDGVISEERPATAGTTGLSWLVDPLDSTANYARDIPIYAVSIAVRNEAGVLAGAVGDPERDVVYSTARHAGEVRVDGRAAQPRHVSDPSRALALFGVSRHGAPGHPRTSIVPATLIGLFGKVRSPGSPALGLAWLAAGRADLAYYEMDFNDWDVSAGVLLCQEAGLSVTLSAPLADGLGRRLLAGVPELVKVVRGPLAGGGLRPAG
jgi:fructose-1,6-bisphosphatase/inositol monophosphatase family enzyme